MEICLIGRPLYEVLLIFSPFKLLNSSDQFYKYNRNVIKLSFSKVIDCNRLHDIKFSNRLIIDYTILLQHF